MNENTNLTDIFRPDPIDKTISLYTGAFKSINVLKETRKPCKELN